MPLSTSRRRKLLKKCLTNIDWMEDYSPGPEDRKRHALVFVCNASDDEDDPVVCLKSRVIIALWDGEDWMEWVNNVDGDNEYHGPVWDVVAWSWLP